MPRFTLVLSAIFCVACSVAQSRAGDFEVFGPFSEGLHLVSFSGQIEVGDAAEFMKRTDQIEDAVVFLNSPGGLVAEGLAIASSVARRGFSTIVMSNGFCASMCGVIWLSGRNRYLEADADVGFHSVYMRYGDGRTEVSGSGNAEIGAYLNTLGLPLEAVRFLTNADPSGMEFIDHEDARRLGIDTVVLEKGKLSTPEERPTPESLARAYGAASVYQLLCGDFLAKMPTSLKYSSEKARNEAVEMIGSLNFERMVYEQLDDLTQGIEKQDFVRTCLRAEDVLREAGMETGIYGPGYDCRTARTASQKALCTERTLWADDTYMNFIYLFYRDAPNSQIREKYFRGQRAWMTTRENCEGDVRCLRRQYDVRFSEVYELVASGR